MTLDVIPQLSATDSIIGLRFVNCSPGYAHPLSVNIQGSTTPLVSSLAYKQSSSFQTSPGSSFNPVYNLEIRDAVTDSVLTTFSGSGQIFKSQTVVITGQAIPNAQAPITAFSVNNF